MLSRPAVSACTSMAAFSVSSSSTTSPASTCAPSSFRQRTSIASLMDSPSGGIRISTATSALQGLLEDRLLLGLMDLVRARRDARGFDPADVGEADVGPEQRREQRPHEPPRALVGRLLLHPADLARRGVTLDQRAHLVGGERVELLDADERHVVALLLASRGEKRSEEHTSELQSRLHLVCRLLLEKKKNILFLCLLIHTYRPAPADRRAILSSVLA